MENIYKSFLLSNGNRLNVSYVTYTENLLNSFDMLGHFEFFHRNYDLGHKNLFEDLNEAIEYSKSKDVIALPVYMYDHSGITVSTTPFSCRWDSGLLGFIWVTKEKIRAEYNCKRITKKIMERVNNNLISEIKLLDDYVTGNVFYFTTYDTKGIEIDSCSGFYGNNFKENGLFDHAINVNVTVIKEISNVLV